MPADYEATGQSERVEVPGAVPPSDLIDGLPDVGQGPGDPPEVPGFDPVLELAMLQQTNGERLGALTAQGVNLQDSHTMVTTMIQGAILEEILRNVAGEGAITRVLLQTHQHIADLLTSAEDQVSRAKLTAGAQGPLPSVAQLLGKGGNRAARRHG
jgi:hypothetical protein